MTPNKSIRYVGDALYCDDVAVSAIIADVGTPTYIYSLPRILDNLARIKQAFAGLDAHIHYSAKANANLTVLRTLIEAGVGVDVVSGGEMFKALHAGTHGRDIVFAGVGKRPDEIRYALENGVGWFNVENVAECRTIDTIAASIGVHDVQIALRFNPQVTAQTHPYIATGHGGAKFGLTADVITDILTHQTDYPNLRFAGIHVHIGSQLHNVGATRQAIEKVCQLAQPYPNVTTINIGGGLPVAYQQQSELPDWQSFADALQPLLAGYQVILEPGRSIVADAGILVTELLYVKEQAGQVFYIVDASMTELMRPALYQAHHMVVPLHTGQAEQRLVQLVGPVCETTDVLAKDITLPVAQVGDYFAMLTSGAYGMVMANTYNARPRPAEVAVHTDGVHWSTVRKRETLQDLIMAELDAIQLE